jgi:hypothetical protein
VTGSSRLDTVLGIVDGSGDSMGRSWGVLAESKVTAFRTIARAEIGGMPVSVTGNSPKDKITAVLVIAPIAQATNTIKMCERCRRTAAHSE